MWKKKRRGIQGLSTEDNYIPNPNTVVCGICGEMQSKSTRCVKCGNNLTVVFDNNNNNGNVYLDR